MALHNAPEIADIINVAANLSTTIFELKHYLSEETSINKYLLNVYSEYCSTFIKNPTDSIGFYKVIWDISVVAYEINPDWFEVSAVSCPAIAYEGIGRRVWFR